MLARDVLAAHQVGLYLYIIIIAKCIYSYNRPLLARDVLAARQGHARARARARAQSRAPPKKRCVRARAAMARRGGGSDIYARRWRDALRGA